MEFGPLLVARHFIAHQITSFYVYGAVSSLILYIDN